MRRRPICWIFSTTSPNANVSAADRINDMIRHAADRLPDAPYIHRPGRAPGTREAIVHPNYIIVYRVAVETITVLAVLHARQQYP